jgi:hypothetical protein
MQKKKKTLLEGTEGKREYKKDIGIDTRTTLQRI